MKVLKIINLLISTALLVWVFLPEFINPYALLYLGVWQFIGNFIILLINLFFKVVKPFNNRLRGRYTLLAVGSLMFEFLLSAAFKADFDGWLSIVVLTPLMLCAITYTYICIKELDIKLTHENINHRWMNL